MNQRSPASKAGGDDQAPLHPDELAFPAGLEPACLRVRSALLIRLSYGKMDITGSRRTIRTCLPPLTAERLHRDGSAGMRWWNSGESNSGRRSCKDQLQPAACPEMVPSAGFEPASCALQARAITRFANWASLIRKTGYRSSLATNAVTRSCRDHAQTKTGIMTRFHQLVS